MPEKNYFLFFILFIFALEAILFSVGNDEINTAFRNEENKFADIQNILAKVSVEAKAYSVYDNTLHKKIYGKNDDISLPIASLTKIMTVAVALNNNKPDEILQISADAIGQEGDYGLFVNEKIKIGDLARYTLIGSANDGAYTLAQTTDNFLTKMNEKAKKIGMEHTLFLNFTGLDMSKIEDPSFFEPGAYATAQDMNILALYALAAYPEVFGASALPQIRVRSESGFEHQIKNTDEIIEKIPTILFSKTGYTPLAGGNLTIIYKDKKEHEIAITILGSTREARFTDMEKIMDAFDGLEFSL